MEAKNRLADPVLYIGTDAPDKKPEEGIALCLSGGGYRAMLFHAGAVLHLHETGILSEVKRISSVSGGSITAGVLANEWDSIRNQTDTTTFKARVIEPIRKLADHTIDIPSILSGLFLPGRISDFVASSYRKYLFGSATLQELPDEPLFVINSTNMQSGALWRFMKPAMRDWKVGEIKNPTTELAVAVAASSAFPPVLSPVVLKFDPLQYTPNSGELDPAVGLQKKVVLTDAGVYDNLGLETAWKRYTIILASDAGAPFKVARRIWCNWLSQSWRSLFLIDNQVRSLRKRQLIQSYIDGSRTGTYWGVGSHLDDYDLTNPMEFPKDEARRLAKLPTRLKRIDRQTQVSLINWGYVMCDTALRRHYRVDLPKPERLPLDS